jgi:hypothetical protein
LQAVVVGLARQVVEGSPKNMHDPNAIDVLRFSLSRPFAWPAIARPRRPPR